MPTVGGYGIVSFHRDIATTLARALRQPTPTVLFRYNRDRPGTPQVTHGGMTIAGHQVTIVRSPWWSSTRRPSTTTPSARWLIDGQPVTVEPPHRHTTAATRTDVARASRGVDLSR